MSHKATLAAMRQCSPSAMVPGNVCDVRRSSGGEPPLPQFGQCCQSMSKTRLSSLDQLVRPGPTIDPEIGHHTVKIPAPRLSDRRGALRDRAQRDATHSTCSGCTQVKSPRRASAVNSRCLPQRIRARPLTMWLTLYR
jgi:hypothetical protein